MTLQSDENFGKKLTCGWEKWQEEFGKFLPEHLKVSKLGLWWGPFIQSRKCMSLKFTEELCIMTMKNDAKFEMELTCRFKIDTTICWIMTRALENLKILHFNGLLSTKAYNVWAKKIQKHYVMFDDTEDWCKICRKTDLCFQKWHEEFDIFSQAEK